MPTSNYHELLAAHKVGVVNLLSAIAYHEAGHAVTTMLAFRFARTPNPSPPLAVKLLSIVEEEEGRWSGCCFGPDIYSTQWPIERIAPEWREAMEWQIVISLAGGIAEAIHRGERNQRNIFWYAAFNCGTDKDLEHAEIILADLRKLTGRQYTEQRFAKRALNLLKANWTAVSTMATILANELVIPGDKLEELVGNNLILIDS